MCTLAFLELVNEGNLQAQVDVCTCTIYNKIHLKSLFVHLMLLILSFGRLEALSFLMIYKALDHRRAKKGKFEDFE